MRKLNTLLSVMALSMSVALFTSCGKNNKPKPQGEKEVSYTEYMKALEGKSRTDADYQICTVYGKVLKVPEGIEYRFDNSPVRFLDMNNPRVRPQDDDLSEYVLNNVMSFASYWSDDEGQRYFINKADKEHTYKVIAREQVDEHSYSDTTYTYNNLGIPTSINTSNDIEIVSGLITREDYPYNLFKELTFTWNKKDTVGTFERVTYEEFHAKALEHEAAECSYQSGLINGTYRQLGTGNTVTLEDEVLTKGSYFEDPLRRVDLSEVFTRRLSSVPNYGYYYFYYSSKEQALMYYEEISNENSYIERVWTFNQYGLVISVQDALKGPEAFPFKAYEYHLTMTYSNDQATITVTLLSGLGKFNGNVDRLTVTAQYGAYLGNVVSSTAIQPQKDIHFMVAI